MNGHIRPLRQRQQVSQTCVSRSLRDRNAINRSLARTERLEHRNQSIDLVASLLFSAIEDWALRVSRPDILPLVAFSLGQPARGSLSLMRGLHRDRVRGVDPNRQPAWRR